MIIFKRGGVLQEVTGSRFSRSKELMLLLCLAAIAAGPFVLAGCGASKKEAGTTQKTGTAPSATNESPRVVVESFCNDVRLKLYSHAKGYVYRGVLPGRKVIGPEEAVGSIRGIEEFQYIEMGEFKQEFPEEKKVLLCDVIGLAVYPVEARTASGLRTFSMVKPEGGDWKIYDIKQGGEPKNWFPEES